ncbi:MAG: hypothetical protein AAGI03_16470, partial [Pseudomonadota bacterium]
MGAEDKYGEFERAMMRLQERGFDITHPDGEIPGLSCPDCGRESLIVDLEDQQIRCTSNDCSRVKVPGKVVLSAGRTKTGPAQAMSNAQKLASADEVTLSVTPADGPLDQSSQSVSGRPAKPGREGSAVSRVPDRVSRGQDGESHGRSHLGEKIIIILLALTFLCIGLLAATMSGFANVQAFAGMVDD